MPWDEIKPRQFPAFEKELDGISKQTMEDHYKLYEGYVKKTNECRQRLKEFDYGQIEGNQVFSDLRAVSVDYTFALLGFKNHDLYFGHLGGEGGDPRGAFAEQVEQEYPGGLAMWQQAVRKAASAARGWVMVGYDLNDGSLFNYIMDTQNLWAVYNMVPVLALDVYEHAYARDFGATPDGRKQYVEAFFRNLDWDHVNRQLAQAKAAREGANNAGAQEPAGAAR
jgi:Fe-Mn family superoxide dismutase